MSKVKGKNRHSNAETESDESNQHLPNLDLSLIRQPIATSVTGFEEVLRAYEAGTSELRKLLSRECDLIYECKVCRNIFRSLTNFISHKRVYCRSNFNATDHFHFRENGFQVQDISTIIQAEHEINNNPNGAAGLLPGSDDKSKDISGIVERLLWKQHQSQTSNLRHLYEQIQKPRDESAPHTIKLNRVNDSDVAVYQSLQMENENSNMKDEIHEVHKMLQKSNTVLGPDGKILNLFNSSEQNGLASEHAANSQIRCKVCNILFETEKTLKLHLEMKHLPSTFVYQCPSCPQKFSSSAAVIKHLSNDHKKNNRRIRLMRDNIIKKRVRADEVVNKPASVNRELQKLQNGSDPPPDDSVPEWNSNDLSGDYQSDSHTCPSCFKTFDRKAVYTSHVQACSDAKCREKSKMKKKKAKEETKFKQIMDFEENSNGSEQSSQQVEKTVDGDVPVNKRKRKRTNKLKKEEALAKHVAEQEESSSVDWNLDDEEEKKKLDNIKKEIIEDDYKRVSTSEMSLNISANSSTNISTQVEADTNDEDDEPKALVIDEKLDEELKSEQKCPQCDKVFDTEEKLKYHLNTYHSRQKRFKCKMCEYQGYRKKDTINHLNCVHNIDGDKETLEKYMESVMKAVDEESLAKQNELKKNQLKIKRKLARERLKLNGSKDGKAEPEASVPPKDEALQPPEVKVEFKEPAPVTLEPTTSKPAKMRRKSLHTSILVPQESDSADDTKKIPKMFIKASVESTGDEKKKKKRRDRLGSTLQPGQNFLNISKFGKIVKRSSSGDSKDGSTQRPIRNRVKPVRNDFLYDLSDLLKKDADAYREQAVQSTTLGFKRELRKRTMSTSTRETPDLSSFDDSSPEAPQMLGPPRKLSKDDDDNPLGKFNRRVFTPPTRPTYPRSPVYKPTPVPTATNPNAGAAQKMAVRESDANRASLFEPKFLWSICFDQDDKAELMPSHSSYGTSTTSAAASILQKLSGKNPYSGLMAGLSKSKSVEEKSTSSMSADQLVNNFDMINVTSVSENELDIPESRAINLNPGRSGLVALALEGAGNDVCVLQECSPDSDDEDDEKPSSSSTEEPKRQRNRKRSKKNSEKRKVGSRLTVMQRLQENKIRASREQLFKRLIMDRQNDDENPSPVYNLFSES